MLDKEARHHKARRLLHEPTFYTLTNALYGRYSFSRHNSVVQNVETFGPLRYINFVPDISPTVKSVTFFTLRRR